MTTSLKMTAFGVPLIGIDINNLNSPDIDNSKMRFNDGLTNFLELKILSVFETLLSQNIINGSDDTNNGPLSLNSNDGSAI
jgi:hypothetical protein